MTCVLLGLLLLASSLCRAEAAKRPNVLFAISDDQSWLHAGAYGDTAIRTPAFDALAKNGVLFQHAYTACPSCTPSRGAILTGQSIWRIEQAGLLFGTLPRKFPVYPYLLAEAGYTIGWTGKSWGPGMLEPGGWKNEHPMGKQFSSKRLSQRRPGMSPIDYAANFAEFLKQKPDDQPFCFWYGSSEPHRSYRQGQGLERGLELSDAQLFASLPDVPEVRSDVLDYYVEIEHFDTHLGRMIELLKESGEFENTLIIVTSDHGMPFPRAKGNLYDSGTHVPLAISWPQGIQGGRTVEDFVSLIDIAPTILAACNVKVPQQMNGRSLLPILQSRQAGQVDPKRDFVVTAFERHTPCRPEMGCYPMRAIRTADFLYIRNYQPDRWPAGNPDIDSIHQGAYGDIDNGPTKSWMMAHQDEPGVGKLFELGFGKRPAEELYAVKDGREQVVNLADDPRYQQALQQLRKRLADHLTDQGDPRSQGHAPWEDYLYYHPKYYPPKK